MSDEEDVKKRISGYNILPQSDLVQPEKKNVKQIQYISVQPKEKVEREINMFELGLQHKSREAEKQRTFETGQQQQRMGFSIGMFKKKEEGKDTRQIQREELYQQHKREQEIKAAQRQAERESKKQAEQTVKQKEQQFQQRQRTDIRQEREVGKVATRGLKSVLKTQYKVQPIAAEYRDIRYQTMQQKKRFGDTRRFF